MNELTAVSLRRIKDYYHNNTVISVHFLGTATTIDPLRKHTTMSSLVCNNGGIRK